MTRHNTHARRDSSGAARLAMLVFFSVALPGLTGCTYTVNRLNDLSDVAHVDVGISVGLLANVGPVLLGAEWSAARIQLGAGGPQWVEFGRGLRSPGPQGQAAYGFFVPFSRFDVTSRSYGLPDKGEPMRQFMTKPQGYGHSSPPWGSVGAEVGIPAPTQFGIVPAGLGVHADVVELADLLTGIFGADIVGDDLGSTTESAPRVGG